MPEERPDSTVTVMRHDRKMVAGAVLTETVFSWPGVGTMIYDAVQKQDFPLPGASRARGKRVVVMTLITDLVVAWLDPRIKL